MQSLVKTIAEKAGILYVRIGQDNNKQAETVMYSATPEQLQKFAEFVIKEYQNSIKTVWYKQGLIKFGPDISKFIDTINDDFEKKK